MRLLLPLFLLGCHIEVEVGEVEVDPRDLEDRDGDGFSPLDGDCDDDNAFVAPDQEEACDGVDTDCDGFGDYEGLCDRYEVFDQRIELDVLFVVDRSSGMADLQQRLIDGVDVFAPRLFEEEGSSRIAVAAADQAGALRAPNGFDWAARPMSDDAMIDWLEAAVDLGTDGDAPAARTAMDGSLDAAFHRPDAHLMIVVVSVQDDPSTEPTVDALANELAHLKPRPGASVHGVVPGATCPEGPARAHEQLVARTGGTLVDVCNPAEDLASSLSVALQSTAQAALATQFFLAEPADPDSVVVQVQEPGGPIQPWTRGMQYHDDPPRVVLSDAPAKGSVVEVQYDRLVE
ncbi:MAG: hypothetical protein ACI8PZ_001704 [Myxococcota bacterium]|jgi:hypothetical protein